MVKESEIIERMNDDESEPKPFARKVDSDFDKIISMMISKNPALRPSSFNVWLEMKDICER